MGLFVWEWGCVSFCCDAFRRRVFFLGLRFSWEVVIRLGVLGGYGACLLGDDRKVGWFVSLFFRKWGAF